MLRSNRWLILAFVLFASATRAEPPTPEPSPPRSPRNANYRIEVRLDPAEHMLHGRQVVRWRNIRQQPTDELWFHLYWNAWRNDASTWLRQSRLSGRGRLRDRKRERDDWGYIEVHTARLPGEQDATGIEPIGAELPSPQPVDLTATMRYESPDDGNALDRSVLVVRLPEPVAPGESVEVEMTWTAKIPRTVARTGFRGDYFFIAQWFPKVAVYEADGWNCHQYHAITEYYSDYGVYDVELTVPANHKVGATGRRIEHRENDDGTATHRFFQEDVHDFAWTSSPDYYYREFMFDEPGLPRVKVQLLMQPEHLPQADRHLDATRAALKWYGTWFGPYPYAQITVVDPAWGSGAGGMEYPTLFTCGTRLFNPFGGDSPESVTVHEAGHQFWYGIVGNNEFEHAWLDEGFNTFSTARALDATYPERILVARYLSSPGRGSGFFPLRFPDITIPRLQGRLDSYRDAALADVPAIPTFRYHPATAGDISYAKTALWLRTLEGYLGWETLQAVMSTYFERFSFGHPAPADFFAVANEVSGQDLSWFFDQVVGDSVVFDYAVDSVTSLPAEPEGWLERDGRLQFERRGGAGGNTDDEEQDGDEEPAGGDSGRKLFRTEVVVKRLGGGVFPVDVLLVFEDGSELRESWDGREHWRLFVAERPAKLKYAVVDPERKLMLDVSVVNNSRVRKPDTLLPAVKWSSKWMLWLQDLLTSMSFFI